MERQHDILIVILNYKTFEMTLELVKQLNAMEDARFDVMVVDNASPNESSDVLRAQSEALGYCFYHNQVNSGYAGGNNIGIRYAIEHGYRYSLIMNNDIKVIDDAFIDKLAAVLDEQGDVACAGPKVVDLDGVSVPPYCDRPSFYDLTLGLPREKRKRAQFVDSPRKVYRLFGCCMLLRNEAMRKVDCMDERTFLYCEEEILAERLLKEGYTSYYCPEARIIHMESSTVKKEQGRRSAKRIKTVWNSMEIYLRDYRRFNPLQVLACKLARGLILWVRG